MKFLAYMTALACRAVVLISLLAIFSHTAYAVEKVKENAPLPTLSLLHEDGREFDFGLLVDRATIVYFTHNSCWYCEQIIFQLKRAEIKFGKENLRIMGINVMARDTELIEVYKEELGFTFPMFAGNRNDLLMAYKINYVPKLVFVDKNKIVRRIVGHYILEPELHEVIREVMGYQ